MSKKLKLQSIEKAQGRAMLSWAGKKPLDKIDYYPAQEKEVYGNKKAKEFNGLYYGDNLQVLSHLLKDYRGKVRLIYIDPPFDSKADYVKKIKIKGEKVEGEQQSLIEQKQYTDIWRKDEYLQFMYERLLIARELLADSGSIYLHCDYRKGSHLKLVLDEIFVEDNFKNQIIWIKNSLGAKGSSIAYPKNQDIIFFYTKSNKFIFNKQYYKKRYLIQYKNGKEILPSNIKIDKNKRYYWTAPKGDYSEKSIKKLDKEGLIEWSSLGKPRIKKFFKREGDYIVESKILQDTWDDVELIFRSKDLSLNYPTQKPEALLERIIKASSNEGDIVCDFFSGSGTTLAVAQKLGRRWIGCDINKGAIQTTIKRLNKIIKEDKTRQKSLIKQEIAGGLDAFKVYNVNNYDVFKNELEAKQIIIDTYGITAIKRRYFDGILDGNFVKVLPVNRVLNKLDVDQAIKGIQSEIDDFTVKKQSEAGESVYKEKVYLICSGFEFDALDYLKKQNNTDVDIEIKNILQEKGNLSFKEPPEAEIKIKNKGKGRAVVEIKDFFSSLLMKRLEVENQRAISKKNKTKIDDFKNIIESVAIDVDYNGKLFNAEIIDTPDKKETIKAKYELENCKGEIAIKIIDVLGEEFFKTFKI